MTALPAGWQRLRFGEAAQTSLGKMLDRGKPQGLTTVPYLRNLNVQWGRFDLCSVLEMELAQEERERFEVKAGDLLVCEGGEIGRAAMWPGGHGYIAYQKALHRVRPNTGVDSTFLRYQLEHLANDGTLARFSTGSTIAHLSQQAIRKVPIVLPKFPEQRRIVGILEEHLSDLADAAASLSSGRRRTHILRARLLEDLTPSIAPSYSLGELTISSGYGTSTKCVVDGRGPAVVRIPNLIDGAIDLSDEKRAREVSIDLGKYMLRAGDVLVVRTNGSRDLIGRTAVVQPGVDGAFASYLIRFRMDPTRVFPEWVALMLERPGARMVLESLAASSAGQYNLSLGKLNRLAIPVPSLEMQSQLIGSWAEHKTALARLNVDFATASKRSETLRRAILASAFAGRLTGQSPGADIIEELAEDVFA